MYLYRISNDTKRSNLTFKDMARIPKIGEKLTEKEKFCLDAYLFNGDNLDITKDPKQKTEILMKLADLQQMKKDPVDETEDNTVHYYLPLTCYKCSLYIANKRKTEKEGE